MTTATFFVNQVNHAPITPLIAGPPNGTLVTNLDELLLWFPTEDPDAGDAVVSYQLQVDSDPAFMAPVINETNLPALAWPTGFYWVIGLALEDLPGSSHLDAGTVYHWRVSAQDSHGLNSSWSAGPRTFQYGIAPPRPGTISAMHPGPNGTMAIEWTGAAGRIFVEHTLQLNPPNWQTIAGPLQGTNWIFTPVPGSPSGFYRLRSE